MNRREYARIVIQETADYLQRNYGFDENGRAHPKKKRVGIEFLLKAMERVKIPEGLRPYHAKGVYGIWERDDLLEELIERKVEQLAGGSSEEKIARLISRVSIKDLKSPFFQTIEGREYKVSMNSACSKLFDSPYEIMMTYLIKRSMERCFPGLKPYHMKRTSAGTYHNQDLVDEMLKKAIDKIRKRKGGYAGLIRTFSISDLRNGFIDKVGRHTFHVNTMALADSFGKSRLDILRRYLRIKDKEDAAEDLRGYHFSKQRRGMSFDEEELGELVEKRIDAVLREQFEGRHVRIMLAKIRKSDIASPFSDRVGDIEIDVDPSAAFNRMTLFDILRIYCKRKNLNFYKKREEFLRERRKRF